MVAPLAARLRVKTKMPSDAAADLTVRERLILFCAASGTDWVRARLSAAAVTYVVVKGLIKRDDAGKLSLTDRGRAVLRTILHDL
jgi:hypothetical protein